MELILLLSSTNLFLSVLQVFMDMWNIKWMDIMFFYSALVVLILCSVTVLLYRERIRRLSDEVDSWWQYRYLEADTETMKRSAEAWLERFNFCYMTVMYMGALCGGILPLQKNIFATEELKPMDKLLFPMWTPFSIEGAFGFAVVCSFQVLSTSFVFFTFGRLCSYLMCVSVTIAFQMKLLAIACHTTEGRVKKFMNSKYFADFRNLDKEYTEELKNEINSCIIHYQKLYSNVQELCRAFSIITNFTYHAGMWLMCLLGVILVREKKDPYMFVRAASAIVSLFLNQYLYSHVSEALTDELENLRFAVYSSPWYRLPQCLKKNINLFQILLLNVPTLRTILGTKTNMKNLSQIMNTSYYYFSAIISFRSKF